jgi:hypothetical protein
VTLPPARLHLFNEDNRIKWAVESRRACRVSNKRRHATTSRACPCLLLHPFATLCERRGWASLFENSRMAGGRSFRAPAKTLGQRLRALRQANEIRSRQAALKKELASGRVRMDDVLAQPPDYARTAKVQDLLLALPQIGPARAARLLSQPTVL